MLFFGAIERFWYYGFSVKMLRDCVSKNTRRRKENPELATLIYAFIPIPAV
jgi:hypothetical protein